MKISGRKFDKILKELSQKGFGYQSNGILGVISVYLKEGNFLKKVMLQYRVDKEEITEISLNSRTFKNFQDFEKYSNKLKTLADTIKKYK